MFGSSEWLAWMGLCSLCGRCCSGRLSGARVVTDAAGNSKLNKGGYGRKMRVRDDVVAASILAVAEGRRIAKAEAQRQPFSHVFL